jgi:hypothetical protein
MSDAIADGHNAIMEAVGRCRPPVVVVEMLRNFGDVLHSTIVVRHIRKTESSRVVWAISSRYVEQFIHFLHDELGPHEIAGLPDLPAYPNDASGRISWVEEARNIRGVERAFGCGVHPWGWRSGSIVDAVLENAGVRSLAVERTPWLPLGEEERSWARVFLAERGISRFIAVEHEAESVTGLTDDLLRMVSRRSKIPMLIIGAKSSRMVPGSVDARGISFLQAKSLICTSSLFLGCASGLSVTAASNGCLVPVAEVAEPSLCMDAIGYLSPGRSHIKVRGRSAREQCSEILDMICAPAAQAMRTSRRSAVLRRRHRR